jgi:hypothetical protein
MQPVISRSKLLSIIAQLKGKIFNVCWTKKSGELRCANVRQYVKSKKVGTGKGIAKNANSYLTVYLMWNQQGNTFLAESGYRVINLDTVEYITFGGTVYKVIPSAITAFYDTTVTAA